MTVNSIAVDKIIETNLYHRDLVSIFYCIFAASKIRYAKY